MSADGVSPMLAAYWSNEFVAARGAYWNPARFAAATPPEGAVRSVLYQFGTGGGVDDVDVDGGIFDACGLF